MLYAICGHFGGLVIASGPRDPLRQVDQLSILAQALSPQVHGGSGHEEEVELAREEVMEGLIAKKHAERIDRYLELSAVSQGEADAYLSRLLRPMHATQVALEDENGCSLSPQETIEFLTDDVLTRGAAGGCGDSAFNRQVRQEVRQIRKMAFARCTSEVDVPFPMSFVQKVLSGMKPRRRSLHLPRAAVCAGGEVAAWVTYAIVNLAAVCGLVSSLWQREVAPLRKGGPIIVKDAAQLRPVGYLDDLGGVFDALWLELHKDLLDAYSGTEQAGGKFDAVLMSVGILIALQVRTNAGLPTLLQKGDLRGGFDLAWRDAIRLHLAWAGITGRMWLVADAALDMDPLRVRLGSLVGDLAELRNVGIGQGRRVAVHKFGALLVSLLDGVKASTFGVGIDPPPAAVRAWACAVPPSFGTAFVGAAQTWGLVHQALQGLAAGSPWETVLEADCIGEARLLTLDISARSSLLMVQFVDDCFILQSTAFGLRCANRALSKFCMEWRHSFKGGAKGPAVLAVGPSDGTGGNFGQLDGKTPTQVSRLDVLGGWLDSALSLDGQLAQVCAKVEACTRELVSGMSDFGFGPPYQVGQFTSRVEGKAFYGAELLASFKPSWQVAVRRLNDVHYNAAKLLLGIPVDVSLGPGGHVRLFAETRFLTRLGARLAQRIIMARCRLLNLPEVSPVCGVVQAASRVIGDTWLDHSRQVMLHFGIVDDMLLPVGDRLDAKVRKQQVKAWKDRVVAPAVRRKEDEWFLEQVSKLNSSALIPYSELLPLRAAFPNRQRWAPWGRTMRRFYRAWCIARMTGGLPMVAWEGRNGGIPLMLEPCPLCGAASVDLVHLVAVCTGTAAYATCIPIGSGVRKLRWLLEIPDSMEVFRVKVRCLGLALSALAAARRRG